MLLLPQLLTFALTLAALLALSRWIARQVQILGLRLTGDEQIAVMVYYLLLLPGIALHELSHVMAARLLGLKVGKLTLGPRRRGRSVELGSVTVGSGGALRDSLVGLAPFLSGTAVLLLVGYAVFDVAALGRTWATDGWSGVWRVVDGIWLVPDFWLWAYVIFAVSNAMTPSPADRQPWLLAGIYVGVALVLAYLLGGLPALTQALSAHIAGALQVLTLGFAFTLALDLIAAAGLLVAETAIVALRR
jgi:hypothetical protein